MMLALQLWSQQLFKMKQYIGRRVIINDGTIADGDKGTVVDVVSDFFIIDAHDIEGKYKYIVDISEIIFDD